jgi:diaminopimelate epimerase
MCHRQFGIGADGVILLQLSQEPEEADFQMRIFNRDGLEALGCGNGLRCLVRFLRDLGVVQKKYRIKTQERVVFAHLANGMPVIDMGSPENLLEIATDAGMVHCVNTGAPHAVQFVDDVDKIDVFSVGGAIRRRLQANVNFASFLNNRSIRVRTFEKGVEGETLSCGTGAAAVAAVASSLYGLKGPISLLFRGGELGVSEKEGRLLLFGPAEKVFTGSFP